MAELTLVQAINLALARAMQDDPTVLVLGEDVGADGGVFRATDGLLRRFGPDRVLDTPLSETAFCGAAVGAALVGMRPIVSLGAAFMWVAMDQFVNNVSKMKYMFGGQATLPIVYRVGFSYGNNSAAQHTDRFGQRELLA